MQTPENHWWGMHQFPSPHKAIHRCVYNSEAQIHMHCFKHNRFYSEGSYSAPCIKSVFSLFNFLKSLVGIHQFPFPQKALHRFVYNSKAQIHMHCLNTSPIANSPTTFLLQQVPAKGPIARHTLSRRSPFGNFWWLYEYFH